MQPFMLQVVVFNQYGSCLLAISDLLGGHPRTPTLFAIDSAGYLYVRLRVVQGIQVAGYPGAVDVIYLEAASIGRVVCVVVRSTGT